MSAHEDLAELIKDERAFLQKVAQLIGRADAARNQRAIVKLLKDRYDRLEQFGRAKASQNGSEEPQQARRADPGQASAARGYADVDAATRPGREWKA